MTDAQTSYDPPEAVRSTLTTLGVGEDALTRLIAYVERLDAWRRRINLIGPASIDDIWTRHILDSAQAWPHLADAKAKPMLDLGSGAGFPGLVLAALGAQQMTMVDSDQRKAVFLRETARTIGVRPLVLAHRFDAALNHERAGQFAIVTARAAAPLERLAPLLHKALASDGFALLHKGARHRIELTEARKSWTMHADVIPSITADDGVLLKIWGVQPNVRSEHEPADG